MTTQKQLAAEFEALDRAWWDLLVAIYGKDARDARYSYLARGNTGSPLRAAYEARLVAHDAWLESRDCGPSFKQSTKES